jgi:hypothetical protein
MKSVIFAVVVAAGMSGISFSSYAQDGKKPPHPSAAAGPSLVKQRLELPSSKEMVAGEAVAVVARPKTGDPAVSGGTSEARSKQDQ